jgi:hypothetical protein
MSLRTVDFSTPFEMLTCTNSFKVPPKKFGYECFVHNISPGISKLDAKSHKCVFVGYSNSKKRYKCYDPVKKRIFESLDVTFRETESYIHQKIIEEYVAAMSLEIVGSKNSENCGCYVTENMPLY